MTKERLAAIVRAILIALGVVAAVLMVFLYVQYRTLRHQQFLNDEESWITSIIHNHGPLNASSTALIRPWMTFDYVNKIFNLPQDYLKTNLPVHDAHYPALTISGYAREAYVDPNAFANTVASSVRAYFAAH